MSQHDFDVANASGSAVRADINLALVALGTWSSGASAPSTMQARMRWVDTTNAVIKRRNAANSAWIVESTDDETRVVSRSSNTILDVSDIGKRFIFTGTFTQTLDAAATLGDGWYHDFRNDGSGIITYDPNASETIDGVTTLNIYPGESGRIVCTGAVLKTIGLQSGASLAGGNFTRDITTASGTQAVTGLGFKPRVLFVLSNVNGSSKTSWGFTLASAQGVIFDNNGANADTQAMSPSNLIYLVASGADTAVAALSSLDDDGFTLSWTKVGSPTGTATIFYVALR